MNFFLNLRYFIFIILLSSCGPNVEKVESIISMDQEQEMIESYRAGVDALEKGDSFFAATKFLEAELLYPQSEWASRSALMAAYSYYQQDYYSKTLDTLNRFLKTYPNHKDIAYAHYLMAITYYEIIQDEKKDLKPLLLSRDKFEYIIKNYPKTEFALDANFKIDLIDEVLASKEMYIARHYQKKKKWVASIRRYQNVIEKYETSIFIEEALHRLVEINYTLGLEDQAKKYASLLGYNYLSSEWYKKSYKILDKNYEAPKIVKEKSRIKRIFKKLFN